MGVDSHFTGDSKIEVTPLISTLVNPVLTIDDGLDDLKFD